MREEFVAALTPDPVSLGREFGDLRALVGGGRFPSRIRCALLAFDALEQALAEENTDGEEG